jgi:hypothetical protein
MLDQIQNRINELQVAINQSLANHNALIGQLNEAKYIHEMLIKDDVKIEENE